MWSDKHEPGDMLEGVTYLVSPKCLLHHKLIMLDLK